MRSVVLVVALAVCVVLGAALFTVLLERKSLRTQLNEFHHGYLALEMEVEALQSASPEGGVDRIRDELESAQARLASTNAKVMTARTAYAEQQAKLNDSRATRETGDSPAPVEEDSASAELSAIMQVESEYATFFSVVPLEPTVAEKVRDVLKEVALNESRVNHAELPQDEEGFADIEAHKKHVLEALRGKLSALLNKEQLAAWEQYEADKPRLMMEQLYDVDLAMYAPGLSTQSRELAKKVFAEEMLREQENAWAIRVSDVEAALSDPKEWVDPEGPAMQRALERLKAQLDEEQLAHVAKFVEQQNRLNRITVDLMHAAQ